MAEDTIAYQFTGLIGGGSNLDGVDGRVLKDGDFAYIMLSGNIQYNYMLDATSGQVEKVPFIIEPDANAGNKRWILQTPYVAYVDATAPDQGAVTLEGYRSLKDLIDAIGATKKATIVCPSTGSGDETTYTFATNETVPANIALIVEEGAILQFDNGVTLSQVGPFEHGLSKCFTWTGTGKIVFESSSVKEIYPQWWGAAGDGIIDDTAAFTAILATSKAGTYPIKIYLVNGNYLITDTLVITSGMIIEGSNKAIYSNSQPGIDDKPNCLITFAPTAQKDLFYVHEIAPAVGNYAGNISLSNFGIVGNSTGGGTNSRYALNLEQVAHSIFENISIKRFVVGVIGDATMTNRFRNIYMRECTQECFFYDDAIEISTSDVWEKCIFRESLKVGTIKKGYEITFDNCIFESCGNGVEIYRDCANIHVINPYVENIPTTADGYVWMVGYSGTATVTECQLSIHGGRNDGRAAAYGGKTGFWMVIRHINSIKIHGGHINKYTTGISCYNIEDTPKNSVYVSGPSFYDVDTLYSLLEGKMWGSYPTGPLVGGAINPVTPFVTDTAAPANGMWTRGSTIWNSTPSAGGDPGWVCVRSENSPADGGEPAAEVDIAVDNAQNCAIGDKVGFQLDNDAWHWSSATNVVGNVITINDAIPAGRNLPDNNVVYWFLFKAMGNLDA